jgi:hypothetical protein
MFKLLLTLLAVTPWSLVQAGCAIQPDANGNVVIPSDWGALPDQAFRDCLELKTLDWSQNTKITEISGYKEFYGCTSLTSTGLAGSQVTTISGDGQTFRGCTSLTSTGLAGSQVTTISGSSTFSYCTSLTSTGLAGSQVTTISGDSTFYGCTSLTEHGLSNSKLSGKLPNYMFRGLAKLDEPLDLRNTYITSIGNNAFEGTTIPSAFLGPNITWVSTNAFADIPNLCEFEIDAAVAAISTVFSGFTGAECSPRCRANDYYPGTSTRGVDGERCPCGVCPLSTVDEPAGADATEQIEDLQRQIDELKGLNLQLQIDELKGLDLQGQIDELKDLLAARRLRESDGDKGSDAASTIAVSTVGIIAGVAATWM